MKPQHRHPFCIALFAAVVVVACLLPSSAAASNWRSGAVGAAANGNRRGARSAPRGPKIQPLHDSRSMQILVRGESALLKRADDGIGFHVAGPQVDGVLLPGQRTTLFLDGRMVAVHVKPDNSSAVAILFRG